MPPGYLLFQLQAEAMGLLTEDLISVLQICSLLSLQGACFSFGFAL